jgi:hypothetical protein
MVLISNSNSFAQENETKIGVGLIYGSEIESLGIRADGYHRVNEDFRVGGALGYFFPTDVTGGEITWFEIDLNGNYIFYEEEEWTIYGLAGLNILIATIDPDVGDSDTNSEIGLNIGGGLEYLVNFGAVFGELKFAGLGGDADQLVLGGGIRFAF